MKQAVLYGLRRGWDYGLTVALMLLLAKVLIIFALWLPEHVLLWLHGGGDMWLSY